MNGESMVKAYCLRCKTNVEVSDMKEVEKDTKKGKRKFLTGTCPNCKGSVWKVKGKT